MPMIANPPPEPSWRKSVGLALICLLILVWAIVVASLSNIVGAWPIWGQTIFYMIAGVAWVFPLKPLLVWMEAPPPR